MQLGPVERQTKRTTRQLAFDQRQVPDIDDCLVLGILHMEVRRRMVFEKHLNDDAIKSADRWHDLLVELVSWPSDYRIEHGTGQDTDHDHDQGDSAGPLLLLELLELVELVSWPSGYRIEHGTGQDTGHDHDQDSSAGPASLVELPATITRRTDQEPSHQARHRPQPRPRHRLQPRSGRRRRPALLVELVELAT